MAQLSTLTINGISFIDIIYPIGSIYETLDESFNPNTSFGGNWERIQGRFLLGAGTPDDNNHSNFGNNLTYNGQNKYNESVGSMGGSSLHTLTITEMPSHNHGLLGEYGATANANYPPTDSGTYIQAAGTSAGTRQAVGSVIVSTGGAEVTTICRLILQFVFGREWGKIIWQN